MATGQSKKKPGCQSTFYMFQSINLCDGHRAKPKRPRMSISLLFTCFDPLIPSHGDWAKPRKNPGFQPIAFTCCDAKTPSDGDWAKPKKARMSVYSVHMFRCVHPILWQLGKAGKTQDVSLLFTCSMRKLCLMGTGQSQKKLRVSAYSVYMFWRVHVVWWPLGKAENSRMLADTVYMLWRVVNSVWWPLGRRR